MSHSKQIVGLFLALVVGFGMVWSLASAQVPATPTPATKIAVRRGAPTWEYKSTSVDALESMPAEGWELGWVTADPKGVVYTWKRQKP